jgi:hypothetical protein
MRCRHVGFTEINYFMSSLMAAEILCNKYTDVNFIFCPYLYYVIGFMRNTKGAPKVIPPISLCWPTALEVDAGGMALEDEPSCQ